MHEGTKASCKIPDVRSTDNYAFVKDKIEYFENNKVKLGSLDNRKKTLYEQKKSGGWEWLIWFLKCEFSLTLNDGVTLEFFSAILNGDYDIGKIQSNIQGYRFKRCLNFLYYFRFPIDRQNRCW